MPELPEVETLRRDLEARVIGRRITSCAVADDTPQLVQLVPRAICEPPCEVSKLERVTAAGFGQRRKMMRQSLKSVFAEPEVVLAKLGLDATARAETLSVAEFARLALEL